MTYYKDNHVTLYNHDCRQMIELPDESVQCVVTSPPYWGLRKYSGEQELVWGGSDCEHRWVGIGSVSDVRKDTVITGKTRTEERFYGGDETRKFNGQHQKHYQDNTCSLCGAWKGSYGLEPTPEMYVQHTIEILREIRRVLRKDGVVFWNIGDSYNSKEASTGRSFQRDRAEVMPGSNRGGHSNGLKPKDLCLIPFRVAIAAQEDGWWVRSVIIWNKPNPMPESVKDRPTESHEYILMLTKSARYYWDQEAVRESQTGNAHSRGSEAGNDEYQAARGSYKRFKSPVVDLPAGRNIRSVWEFPTQPYPEAHFAVFPEKLPELCIKAATPEVGCCSKCGSPWKRVTQKQTTRTLPSPKDFKSSPVPDDPREYSCAGRAGENVIETLGWQPTCKCQEKLVSQAIKATVQSDGLFIPEELKPVPSVVLDPFAGAGTTLWVAKKLNRQAVGYEISEEYCRLARDRVSQQVML